MADKLSEKKTFATISQYEEGPHGHKEVLPPKLRKEFIKIEVIQKGGGIAIYGVDKKTDKKRPIGYKKLIEAYGHDPKARPEPQQAVWESSGEAHDVTVIGSYGLSNGEEYMKIKGSTTGIPRSQLEWIKQETPLESNESLAARLDVMERRLNEWEERNQLLEAENQRLKNANEHLLEHNQRLAARLSKYEDPSLIDIAETEPDMADSTTRTSSRGGFSQMTGWLGRHLSRDRTEPLLVEHTTREDGHIIIEEEEVNMPYSPAERRRGAAVVAGALVLGVAVLGAWGWGEHEEGEGAQSQLPKIHLLEHDNHVLQAELKADNSQIEKLKHQINQFHQAERAEVPKALNGAEFYVEPGHGITQEIQDFALARGYAPVSGGQAWMIYENMRAQFGDELVLTANGVPDTYIRQQGDVGISQPGSARWPKPVEAFLISRLSR